MTRRRIVPVVVYSILLLLCAACSRPTVSVTTAMRTASLPTQGAYGATTFESETPSAGETESPLPPTMSITGAESIVVPITTSWPSSNEGLVIVEISVAGGPNVPVQLDTGSSGLLIDESAVGPEVDTTGGQPFSTTFVSGTVNGTSATGTVTIGGVSTADPIEIGLLPQSAFSGSTNGTRGLMGIASTDGAGFAGGIFAPNLQLPAALSSGSTFNVAQTGSGTWTLGPVVVPAGAIDIPLVPATGTTTYPNGATVYAKDVDLCWTISNEPQACGPTDLDLGSPRTALNVGQYGSLNSGNGEMAAGQALAIASQAGVNLWSFTTGSTVGQDVVALDELGTTTTFNTGIGFFFSRVVAFDYAGGRLLVTGQPTAG